MKRNAPSPEPAGVPRMFGPDSWKRPDAAQGGETPPPSRQWPDKVTLVSLAEWMGRKRVTIWRQVCADYRLDFESLFRQAVALANEYSPGPAAGRHLDAKSFLRASIYDGIRGYLDSAGTPNAPRPVLH